MADAVREQGFAATTVAEVVRRARTSRRTFYQHFEDREACFLALCDMVSERLLGTVAQAAADAGDAPWGRRVDAAVGAYLAALAADPELSLGCLREIRAVGPAGVERSRALDRRWAQQITALVAEAGADDPAVRPLSAEIATVITGGFRDLVLDTLEQGRDPNELRGLAGDLIRRVTQR
ncbi:TetR/AcrR family transcriptional regulator [Baekduia soli]|nr:TetR/AcrR family transcriptional regulator [Baekduia soli]